MTIVNGQFLWTGMKFFQFIQFHIILSEALNNSHAQKELLTKFFFKFNCEKNKRENIIFVSACCGEFKT